jgi:hypothetical protein
LVNGARMALSPRRRLPLQRRCGFPQHDRAPPPFDRLTFWTHNLLGARSRLHAYAFMLAPARHKRG